ncbi:MAG: hypothetical protein JEZ06_01500 [Anaerolineaceae bacterium]|nr:hypothetical protein [Anaerolineaceae bacterium]
MSKSYLIKIKGHLDQDWSIWFSDMSISYDEFDNTVLKGIIPDQPALHGILDRIRDMNLILISVEQSEFDSEK